MIRINKNDDSRLPFHIRHSRTQSVPLQKQNFISLVHFVIAGATTTSHGILWSDDISLDHCHCVALHVDRALGVDAVG